MNKTKDLIGKECFSEIIKYRRCTAAISVGVGKTLIGLKRIEHGLKINPNAKILIVAPKISIFETWKLEAKKWNLEYILNNITFSTYRSLNKQGKYLFIILDEIHSLKFSHNIYLSSHKGGILGLTGTPPDEQNKEKFKMIERYAPIVYEYVTDDAVDDGLLNDYEIFLHKIPLGTEKNIEIKTKKASFKISEIDNYNYYEEQIQELQEDFNERNRLKFVRLMRMQAMKKYKSKEEYVKKIIKKINNQCIIFANTIDQAERISLYSYNSKNKASNEYLELFKEGKINVLSCIEQLSEGINIPNLDTGIVLHTYSGNSPKAKQKFGRLMRLPTNKKCTLHVLVYKDTIDETWVNSALERFNSNKIKIIEE